MIRRLMMVLLLLGLALPALASPLSHSVPPPATTTMAAHHHDHGQPSPPVTKHVGKHECIGCVVADDAPAFEAIDLPPCATPGWILAAMPALYCGKPAVPPPKA